MCTLQAPLRGSTIHSLSPVVNICVPPGWSSTIRRLLWVQPARLGSMSSAYCAFAVAPLGTYSSLLMRPAQQSYGGVHGRGDIVVRRVQQRTADHHATDGGQLERVVPLPVRAVLVLADVAAEQHGRQGGGLHHPGHVVRVLGDGDLQPGV